jgi:hypothetical protein
LAWWLLVECDAGIRKPALVELPLAAHVSDLEFRTAELAALMFGLHRSEGIEEPARSSPMPFSVTLVTDRLRVSRGAAGRAIKALRQAGTIVHVDSIPGRPRLTPRYRPGDPTDE